MKAKALSVISFVLIICTLLSTTAFATAGFNNFRRTGNYTNQFTDVPEDSWYEENVKAAYELGLMNGTSDTYFNADGNLSIAETVTIASRINSTYYDNGHQFTSSDPWYRTYIDYAVEQGIIAADEYSDYTQIANRTQFASILAASVPEEALPPINNITSIPDFSVNEPCADAVYLLYNAGILTGSDRFGSFAPSSFISRAEVAAIVTRIADPGLRRIITLDTIPVPATGIALDQNFVDLFIGNTYSLAATVSPANTTETVSWSSSNTLVATVSEDGVVTAVGEGNAVIYATIGEHVAACSVSVDTYDIPANITVRVNGKTVKFPDGQPFVDGNNRTLIPVRFVSEQMGAEVEWDGPTQSASISKNGITVVVTIGSPVLKVTDSEGTETVEMDTAAVVREGRIYVPIRFVAEALGGFVDYSDTHSVVSVFSDVLTADQIAKLQAYGYTQPEYALSYEDAKNRFDEEELISLYGTDRERFGVFANAREHLYHTTDRTILTYVFDDLGVTAKMDSTDEFYETVVKETVAEISYESKNVTIQFITDSSCIYQPDDMDTLRCTVRGTAVVTMHKTVFDLTDEEIFMLTDLGLSKLSDETIYIDVDVHMNTVSSQAISAHTIVPLSEAY